MNVVRHVLLVAVGLLLVPLSALAKERNELAEIQNVVGKDWKVTAVPDGYIVTYLPEIIFYSSIAHNSKLSDKQRLAGGRTERLKIRVIPFTPDFSKVTPWGGLCEQKNWPRCPPGFQSCGAENLGLLLSGSENPGGKREYISPGQKTALFFFNFPETDWISPATAEEGCSATVAKLAHFYHWTEVLVDV